MYRLVRHREKWAIAYTVPGTGRVRRSLGTADRGQAESRAGEVWAAINRPAGERVADLWPAYVQDRLATVSRKDRFDSLWRALGPHFGYKFGKAITREDCRAYAKARAGKAASTIRTELEFLRACLRWRYGKEAPALWLPPASKPRERYLTDEERDRLLAAIDAPHVRLFVVLALSTGARMGALLDLKWSQVDLEHGFIDLNPAGREITSKRRTTVPINRRLDAELRKAFDGRLTDYVIEYGGKPVKSVKKAIASASRRSGVPCSPHVFRHTAGVKMAQADVPMQKIAQYLGHTSTRITETHYARYSPRFMEDAAAALEW